MSLRKLAQRCSWATGGRRAGAVRAEIVEAVDRRGREPTVPAGSIQARRRAVRRPLSAALRLGYRQDPGPAPDVGAPYFSRAPCPASIRSSQVPLEPVERPHVELRQLDRITFNPAVMGGKPCIRGMRVTVGMIASGHDTAEIRTRRHGSVSDRTTPAAVLAKAPCTVLLSDLRVPIQYRIFGRLIVPSRRWAASVCFATADGVLR
jgi:hypothetical protein